MIYIATALACEAKPVIDKYKLKRQTHLDAFPCYSGEEMHLIVSGMGRIAMAAATAYLAGNFPPVSERGIWLNIGIAGHPELAQGQAVMASKVIEQSSGKTWYPIFTVWPNVRQCPLLTVDEPEQDYRESCLYDMEGSAFMEIASRFTSFEFIHLYKLVSDNRSSGVAHIDKAYTTSMIAGKIHEIETLITNLQTLRRNTLDFPREENTYLTLIKAASFSFSQKKQLRRLLQRFFSLAPQNSVLDQTLFMKPKSAKQVLVDLSLIVDNLAVGDSSL